MIEDKDLALTRASIFFQDGEEYVRKRIRKLVEVIRKKNP